MKINEIMNQNLFFAVFLFWSFFWKTWALWKAAGKKHLVWFILLMVINTFGLLEIAYIFYLNRWDIDKGRLLKILQKRFSKEKKGHHQ
ncbi:MAG: hypothetical protein BWY24_00090 [Microgenomates group bacterium ADurb.Bin219]|nr:MAG: hypothetical protein BWY24_00090 [Microgenomates group bacterium ADurb.Bin219]HNP89645.1 DUF5652 family protein [Candidatus Woesebacteria bacterium]